MAGFTRRSHTEKNDGELGMKTDVLREDGQ